MIGCLVERYSRQAEGTLEITFRSNKGETSVMRITSEHPIHLEGWDGKPRNYLLASLKAMGAVV